MKSRSRPLPRVYVPEPIPPHGLCGVPAEQAHHLARVLRLAAGDPVIVFDGRGTEYDAAIEGVARGAVTVRVLAGRAIDRESPMHVVLAQGISSGERMDYTVQKAVELGVAAIQPLTTERSVVRLDEARGARRVAHWQSIAIAACAQSGRNVVPQVHPTAALTAWLGTLTADAARLMLAPAAATRLSAVAKRAGPLVLLVGPEGGLTPREHEDAALAGFSPVRLGPRVLRTETAAVAALAAMQALWGDF